ncbi:MAG: tetratricopeptide repeat protein, partial [Lysobacterales bacterium]
SLLASGDTDKAIDELETASELNQGLVQADVMLVLTLLQTRDFERAAKTAQALAEKEPKSAMPLNLLGIAEMGQNDLVSARKAFEQALAVDPKFTVAELNLAQIDLRENKPEAAEARYQAVVARDPGNVQALLALAERAE